MAIKSSDFRPTQKGSPVNVRKISLTLEVAFWNFVISTLTIVKDLRSYPQSTPATFPILRKFEHPQSINSKINHFTSNIRTYSDEIKNIFIKVFISAILGFIIGFILGILLGT